MLAPIKRTLLIALAGFLLFCAVNADGTHKNAEYLKKLEAFETWYKGYNPVADKIVVVSRPSLPNIFGNVSVHLKIDSAGEGDSIFETPEELVISQTTVDNSALGPLLQANKRLSSELSALENLALFFLYGRLCAPSNPKEFFWAPYFSILPDAADLNHVLLMTSDEVELLKGSFAYSTAVELRSRSLRTYKLIFDELFKNEDVEALATCTMPTEADWHWAMATVLGRSQNYIDLKENGEPFPVVVPYFDFIGHYPTASPLYGRTKEGVYHAELEIHFNREVFRGFSNDCPAMLFVRFGLYVEDNEWPCTSLPPQFMNYAPRPTSPELAEKREQGFAKLKEAGMTGIYQVFESTISEELLLRSEMVTMELADYEAIDNADNEMIEHLAAHTRARGLRWLADSAKHFLAHQFPTTIEQDEAKLLKTDDLSHRAKIALSVIHQEKLVLKKFITIVDAMLSEEGTPAREEL